MMLNSNDRVTHRMDHEMICIHYDHEYILWYRILRDSMITIEVIEIADEIGSHSMMLLANVGVDDDS